jgi:hypothetical protein
MKPTTPSRLLPSAVPEDVYVRAKLTISKLQATTLIDTAKLRLVLD